MSERIEATSRSIGLWGATGIGVGAIVGGGILVLAGVAFSASGPAAIVAFAINGVIAMLTALSIDPPAWFDHRFAVPTVAILATLWLAIHLTFSQGSSGAMANVGKLVVFGVLIGGGLWAIFRQDPKETSEALRPFFSGGLSGLVQAMGYSFIALQGFDLIAAVGGEVRNPTKTVPRAMILSLIIALCIYLPLLLVIAT